MLNYTFHHYQHSYLYWNSVFFFFFSMKIQITVCCHFFSVYRTSFSTSYMASILAMKSLFFVYLDTSLFHFHFGKTDFFFLTIEFLVVDICLSALLMSTHCLWAPLLLNRQQLSFLLWSLVYDDLLFHDFLFGFQHFYHHEYGCEWISLHWSYLKLTNV